jgi:hypothetical protein
MTVAQHLSDQNVSGLLQQRQMALVRQTIDAPTTPERSVVVLPQ